MPRENSYSPYTPYINAAYGQSPYTNYDPYYDPLYQELVRIQQERAQQQGSPLANTVGQIGGAAMADKVGTALFPSGATSVPAAPEIISASRGAAPVSAGGGVASYIPGAIGAYGAYDLLRRGDVSPGRGALQGAASGAGIGFSLGGPVGAGIGAGIGGLVGLGKSIFGKKSKTKVEDKRYKDLREAGILGFGEDRQFTNQGRDRQLQEALKNGVEKDFVGISPNGQWVNTKFLVSGKESDLRPEDIWGYSAFGEKFGNDWLGKFSEDQRRQVAQRALDLGLVREHHGTIDLKSSKDLDDFVASLTKKK